jgi:hypothetical protein
MIDYSILTEGYLAQMNKAYKTITYKPHTLSDYRKFKKDAINSNNATGRLGFDYESEAYKKKVTINLYYLIETELKIKF